MKKVAIVGGGIGALAIAPLLAQKGYSVTVYEKNSWLGGRAGVFKKNGFTFDTGPSWLMMPEVFEQWFVAVGYDMHTELSLKQLDPSYRVYWSNGYKNFYPDIEKIAKEWEGEEEDLLAKLQQYYNLGESIYTISMKEVLTQPQTSIFSMFNPKTIRSFLQAHVPLSQPLLNYLNTRFSNKRLQEALLYHLAFLGTIPQETNIVFATMNYIDMRWGVWYPMGGIHSLIDRMVSIGKEKGVHYLTNSSVDTITTTNNRVTGVRTQGKEFLADIIISNAPREYTDTTLLKVSNKQYPPAPSALLIFAGMNKKLTKVAHHSIFFADQWNKYYQALKNSVIPEHLNWYLCAASTTDPSVAPEGKENLSWVLPLSARRKLTAEEEKTLVQKVIKQTEEYLKEDIFPYLEFTEHRSHEYFEQSFNSPHGTAIGIPGTLFRSGPFRPRQKSPKIKNMYYVGADTHPGIGMPMCVLSAMNLQKLF